MKPSYGLILLAALSTLGTGVWASYRGRPARRLDLFRAFVAADKHASLPIREAFTVGKFTINGDTKRGVYAHPRSSLSWHLTMPTNARLRVFLGLRQDAWDKSGNGVLFRIGIEQGQRFEELLRQHVNPMVWLADRRWVPVDLDLSAVGGREVDLVFLIEVGPETARPDPRHDWAIWGEPQILVYR